MDMQIYLSMHIISYDDEDKQGNKDKQQSNLLSTWSCKSQCSLSRRLPNIVVGRQYRSSKVQLALQ